jgi:hypothetical protein
MHPPAGPPDDSTALIDGPRGRGIEDGTPHVPGHDLGPRFVEALVRGDFNEMESILHPQIRFRGLSPHKSSRHRPRIPSAVCSGRFGCGSTRGREATTTETIRSKSREMAEFYRDAGYGHVPDDTDWLVEQRPISTSSMAGSPG